MEKALGIQIPEERPSAVPAKAAKREVKFIPAGNYGLANVMGLKPGNDALLAKFIKPAVVPEFVQKAQRRQSKTSEQLEPVAPVVEAVAKPAAPVVEAVAKPAAIVSPPASNPASVAPSPKEVPKELTESQKAFKAKEKAEREMYKINKARPAVEKAAREAEAARQLAMTPEEKIAEKRAKARAQIAKWKEQGVMGFYE